MIKIHYDKQSKNYYLTVNDGYVIAYVNDPAWVEFIAKALNEYIKNLNEEVK